MMGAKPVGWPDLHGFEVDLRGEEEEREEHDERTPTRYKSGCLSRAQIHPPNRINKIKTLG